MAQIARIGLWNVVRCSGINHDYRRPLVCKILVSAIVQSNGHLICLNMRRVGGSCGPGSHGVVVVIIKGGRCFGVLFLVAGCVACASLRVFLFGMVCTTSFCFVLAQLSASWLCFSLL